MGAPLTPSSHPSTGLRPRASEGCAGRGGAREPVPRASATASPQHHGHCRHHPQHSHHHSSQGQGNPGGRGSGLSTSAHTEAREGDGAPCQEPRLPNRRQLGPGTRPPPRVPVGRPACPRAGLQEKRRPGQGFDGLRASRLRASTDFPDLRQVLSPALPPELRRAPGARLRGEGSVRAAAGLRARSGRVPRNPASGEGPRPTAPPPRPRPPGLALLFPFLPVLLVLSG